MTQWIRPFAPLLITAIAGASIVGLWLFVQQPPAQSERSTVDTPVATEVLESNIPPIDAAVPDETETATFAMG
jgi:hypothetical protein